MNQRRCKGYAYVEALLAAALLAISVAPIADAVRTALDASRAGEARMRELRCMKNKMETVIAEPYKKLWDAARGPTLPTSYSEPADGACVARDVYIAKYLADWDTPPVFLPYPDVDNERDLEMVLLYVTVSSPDTRYSFTTVVKR